MIFGLQPFLRIRDKHSFVSPRQGIIAQPFAIMSMLVFQSVDTLDEDQKKDEVLVTVDEIDLFPSSSLTPNITRVYQFPADDVL